MGLVMMVLVVLQVVGGMLSRLLLKGKMIEMPKLRILRKGHHFLGYLLAIVYKIVIMWAWQLDSTLYTLICWEAFWIILFFCVKFGRTKMAKSIID